MADGLKWHWWRLTGASLLVLAAAQLAPRFVRAPDLVENRVLADAPPAPPKDLDSYRKAADAWVADRFPPRVQLIAALNWLRLQAGVSGSDRVIVGRDGWLFHDNTTHLGAARGVPHLSDEEARAWLTALAGRTEWLAARGIAYVVLAPPDKETLFGDKGPAWYAGPDPNRTAVMLPRLAAGAGAGQVVYPFDDLVQPTRWGLKTYTPNDTHWSGLGAYYGYAALMRTLAARGVAEGPRPLESFTEVRRDEVNKPRNLAMMLGVASFVDISYPEIADPAAMSASRTTYLTDRHDWTAPHVIDTGQAGKPVLLMTMDSFSNAFVPLLYPHFSRIVLAHNQDGAWREDLIERFHPNVVVLEVLESGLIPVMSPAPAASAQAQARIAEVVAHRRRYGARPAAERGVLEGGEGPDRLTGGVGDDAINGRPGDDTLLGGLGNDTLRGGRGADQVEGGPGDDWLAGGREDDILAGGPGADVFNSFADAGTDTVLDFSAAEGDRVELDPGVAFQIRQAGADTVVEMLAARLILKGVMAADLKPGTVRNR